MMTHRKKLRPDHDTPCAKQTEVSTWVNLSANCRQTGPGQEFQGTWHGFLEDRTVQCFYLVVYTLQRVGFVG